MSLQNGSRPMLCCSDCMGNNKTICSATLIVLGDDLYPNMVSGLLNLAPSQSWRKGEHHQFIRHDGTVQVFDTTHDWGGWKLWLPEELRQMPLDAQIKHWANLLGERAEEIRELKSCGFTIELNCSVTSRTYFLQVMSELQKRLGELGVDMAITFYSARPKRKLKKRKSSPYTDVMPAVTQGIIYAPV